MATTGKRVNNSIMTETIDTMDFNNWKLTFQYRNEASKPITQLNVTGQNSTGGYFTFSRTFSFNGADFDADLLAAVNTETQTIIEKRAV